MACFPLPLPCLTPPLGNLLEFLDEIYPVKIRGMGLPNGEKFHDPNFNRFLLIHPCDRRTDGRAIPYSALSMLLLCCRAKNRYQSMIDTAF